MTTAAASIAYSFEKVPGPGQVLRIAEGVFWLRMPLPFALDHINLWLLEDGDGWTIVDTGLASDACKANWEQVFQNHLAGRPVTRVLVTHFHPDHVGLAGWLTQRWQAPLWMPRSEWLFARLLSLDTSDEMMRRQIAFYRGAGCSEDYLATVRARGPSYAGRVTPIPVGHRSLRDGDQLAIGGRDWQVIVGRGHSPEHACLYCPDLKLLISGDQVLPKISPNVGVHMSEPEADPLNDFMASLDRLAALPADTHVLPSHNAPFHGLHGRLDELRQHHEDRLDDLLAVLDRPRTAMEVCPTLFRRPLDHHQTGFAIAEALAHLHHLRGRGLIEGTRDAEGRHRYARITR